MSKSGCPDKSSVIALFNFYRIEIKFWSIYLLITGVCIILLLEGAVRLFAKAPLLFSEPVKYVKDRYLPYKLKPFTTNSGRSNSGEFDYEYKINSLGFRDIEHNIIQPKNTFRILGLGDSFTFGQGASFEETYLFRLETMLNARQDINKRIETINMGIPRFFPEPERLVLEHYGLKFHSDLILVGFLPNDISDTYTGIDFITVSDDGYMLTSEANKLGKIGSWLYIHSHLARTVLGKYVSYKIRTEYPVHYSDVFRADGHHEKDWKKVELEFEKIIELARKIGSKITFIHIPQQGPWVDSASYPAKRLSKWCSGQGVNFIDILPAMKKASKDEVLYWKKDGHCTSAGYRIIAETICSQLIEKGLVP